MSKKVFSDLDFNSVSRILNLPNPSLNQEPATKAYVDSVIEGLAWKDQVKVATQGNINLSSPGSSIDGISLNLGDRILVRAQTSLPENGIYLFDTASTPLVRAEDANTFTELEQAVVSVAQGTSADISYRQTEVGGVIDTNDITWEVFGTVAPASSETTPGILEIATQAEVDTGTDDTRAITPAKLAAWSNRIKKYATLIGDGVETTYTITHNFNTRDVHVSVYYNSGTYDDVLAEVTRPSTNTVQVTFTSAPTSNQFKVVVIG